MMKSTLLTILIFLFTTLFTTGCDIGDSTDSNITMSLRVSALTYIRENNETNDTLVTINDTTKGTYITLGRFDFYDENITGERKIINGVYLIESDVNCSDYPDMNISENAPAPTMKAPDKNSSESKFAYININPFTTLLVDSGYSKETLQGRFPEAASVDEDFNFDTATARFDRDFNSTRLTQEICEALNEVISLQL
jgi:hypothetical protein